MDSLVEEKECAYIWANLLPLSETGTCRRKLSNLRSISLLQTLLPPEKFKTYCGNHFENLAASASTHFSSRDPKRLLLKKLPHSTPNLSQPHLMFDMSCPGDRSKTLLQITSKHVLGTHGNSLKILETRCRDSPEHAVGTTKTCCGNLSEQAAGTLQVSLRIAIRVLILKNLFSCCYQCTHASFLNGIANGTPLCFNIVFHILHREKNSFCEPFVCFCFSNIDWHLLSDAQITSLLQEG